MKTGRWIFLLIVLISASVSAQDEISDSLIVAERTELKQMIRNDPDFIEKRDALNRAPNNVTFLNELGDIYFKYSYLDEAEALFEKSVKIENNAEIRYKLGLVKFEQGRSVIILFEALKKVFNKDNYTQAIKEFERALQLDPTMHKARLKIVATYIVQGGDGNLGKAHDVIDQVLSDDPVYPQASYFKGLVYYEQKEYDEAVVELLKELDRDPDSGPANIYLGLSYFRQENLDDGTVSIDKGFENLTDEALLKLFYTDMRPLFSKEENNEYLKSTVKLRGPFIAEYWRKHDPDFFTPGNERLNEHIKRVDLVKSLYHENNFRGYDDRGKIYLKYGEPAVRHVDNASSFGAHDNESWLYSNISNYLAFDFVSIGGIYRLVPDLSYASTPRSLSTGRLLYNDRLDMGGVYSDIGGKASTADIGFTADLSLFRSSKNEAIAKAPAEFYNHTVSGTKIEFPLAVSQFKGGNGQTEVEIYYGIPLEQFAYEIENGVLTANVQEHFVVADSSGKRLDEVKRSRTLQVASIDAARSRFNFSTDRLSVNPGDYLLGFSLKQESAQKIGLYQFTFLVRDFRKSDLMISDLMVSIGKLPSIPGDIDSRVELDLTAYPFAFVKRNSPLVLYFETYNLMIGDGSKTSYSIEYSLQRNVGKDNIFKKFGRFVSGKKSEMVSFSQERIGTSVTAREALSIDLSTISVSEVLIKVKVKDMVSGEEEIATKLLKIIE